MQGDPRRSARLLALSWVLSWAGVPISAAFGSVIVLHLTHDLALTGVPYFLVYLGSLAGAYPAGHLMDHVGRKPVLVLGHLVTATGFAGGAAAILAGNLYLFLACQFVAAMGTSATYLTRLAVADLYPASKRARGIGWLSFAVVLGAFLGLPLAVLARRLSPAIGDTYLAIAWSLLPVLSLAAAFVVSRVHPDPRVTAHEIQGLDPAPLATPEPEAAAARFPWRLFLSAAGTLAFAQATMVALMSVSGAALDHAGHGSDFIVGAFTFHLVSMFGFAPWIGVIGDRWGRRNLLPASAVYLIAATLLVAYEPSGNTLLVALFLVGLGWSFAFLGATAIALDVAKAAHRGRIMGAIDFVVALNAMCASLFAGWALDEGGLPRVGRLALVCSVLVAAAALLSVPGGGRRLRVPGASGPQDLGQ